MKKRFLITFIAIFALIVMVLPAAPVSAISESEWNPVYTPQIHLDPTTIEQFAQELPVLSAAGGTIQTVIAGSSRIEVHAKEFKSNMLPGSFTPEDTVNYDGSTWVWGYITRDPNSPFIEGATRETFTGPAIVATRGISTEVKFVNDLGTGRSTKVLAYKYSTDQSLHWANPAGVDKYVDIDDPVWVGNPAHYADSIPMAVHLHGAEDPAAVDGGPDSWFTSDGQHGPAFFSEDGNTDGNYCIYTYPNTQEAAPLWFHDHTLGATRLNVYAGVAGAYALIDPDLILPGGLTPIGLDRNGGNTTNTADEFLIPLVVQDRMFDTNGQLLYNTGPMAADPQNPPINPEHPYWTPEFFGDTVAVNGKVWPYLDIDPQRYLFSMINGSNSRAWELSFRESFADDPNTVPSIWQIATDGGYLDNPVQVDPLVTMPGERAVFIVDFSGFEGEDWVLHNLGPDEPFDGVVGSQPSADPNTTGKVMEFRVSDTAVTDNSYDPGSVTPIRTGEQQIVRLVDPVNGTLASGVNPALTRELTLVEVMNDNPSTVNGIDFEGGPLEVLVNNTKWMGTRPDEMNPNMMGTPVPGFLADGIGNYLSELPVEGTTEVWEIVNLTADAHPIHTHLAQFQLMNRQAFSGDPDLMTGYYDAYASAFPGNAFMPAYGPPLDYSPSALSGGKYGGNPDVTPYLNGAAIPPNPNEAGWKDTIQVPPGMVTRFVVRWGPLDAAVGTPNLQYAFVPNGPIPNSNNTAMFDFVWHCHIVDHEDNEMMRPYAVYTAPVVNAGEDEAIPCGGTLRGHTGSFRASGAAPWTATVNWGDGSATQPVTLDLLNFTLPAHQFPSVSAIYTVTVTVTDGLGVSGTDTFKVTVTCIAFNPTTLNLKSKGQFKVTIFGGPSFNVNNIDQASLKFGPTAFEAPFSSPVKVNVGDANGDGIPDLLVFFDTPDELTSSTTQASIWGTISGLDFVGTTAIKVLSK